MGKNLKIDWYRSATVGIHSAAGNSILCDPWITDGAFLGSWYHFPPLQGHEFDELLSRKWDAIYISHLHADHFDRKFVSALARAQPNCTVIIPDFAHHWLHRAVTNCGFSEDRITLASSGNAVDVGDISVTVYVADHCDPNTCGVSVPCHTKDPRVAAFDSMALFEADGQSILNANDALAVKSIANVLPAIGQVDLLLGHYGGAGPFPQTFPDIPDEEKKRKANALAQNFLNRLAQATRELGAKYVMPFAGQYVLGGRLTFLNEFRSVVSLSEALEWMSQKTDAKPVGIKPFSSFDLDTGEIMNPWEEPAEAEIEEYLATISGHLFPYEKKTQEWANAEEELSQAFQGVGLEYQRRLRLGVSGTSHRISIETARVSGFIDFEGPDFSVFIGALSEMTESETRLSCHPGLLKGMIQRSEDYEGFTPMHFNQAEIGSHFLWRRNGDFDEVIRCLNFMQAGSHRRIHLLEPAV